MKAQEFKEILESMEVGLFDKWMERFELNESRFNSLDEYLNIGLEHGVNDLITNFSGIGLYDDNDTQEVKQYWWDLMGKYDEIMKEMGYDV